jgi:hypothetical protein
VRSKGFLKRGYRCASDQISDIPDRQRQHGCGRLSVVIEDEDQWARRGFEQAGFDAGAGRV